MSIAKNILLLDGHGKVALRLTRLLAPNHKVTSIIQNAEYESEVTSAGATPVFLPISTATITDLTKVFEGKEVIYLLVGCGLQQGEEIYKTTYYDFSIKVYDAIEAVSGSKPRLITLTGVDVRDLTKPVPAHYTEEDIEMSQKLREWFPNYMKWKYEGNRVLAGRTTFKWTMLRGGGFGDTEGTGKAAIGRTGLCTMISWDDVATTLALLVNREDAHGLALDIVGGETPIEEGLDAAIKKGETDFLG